MARPLRIEFPGALYHVTSRGNGEKQRGQTLRTPHKFHGVAKKDGSLLDFALFPPLRLLKSEQSEFEQEEKGV